MGGLLALPLAHGPLRALTATPTPRQPRMDSKPEAPSPAPFICSPSSPMSSSARLLATACSGDRAVTISDSAPEADIPSPNDGDGVFTDEAIEFRTTSSDGNDGQNPHSL